MKLFQITNTPEGCFLPKDAIILIDVIDKSPVLRIRLPWTQKRKYFDPNSFLEKYGPCFYAWVWIRTPSGNLLKIRQWMIDR